MRPLLVQAKMILIFTDSSPTEVVNNACATLAVGLLSCTFTSRAQVINALGNVPGLLAGSQLSELLAFATSLDPGLVITSCDWLREAHNALPPPSAISLDGLGLPKTAEDAYHFVVYLPVMGCLYELDGLKQCAVKHGLYHEDGEEWVAKAREVIPHCNVPNRCRAYITCKRSIT
jgi:ubiquitin carboxyl-terminal hydrolase L5